MPSQNRSRLPAAPPPQRPSRLDRKVVVSLVTQAPAARTPFLLAPSAGRFFGVPTSKPAGARRSDGEITALGCRPHLASVSCPLRADFFSKVVCLRVRTVIPSP